MSNLAEKPSSDTDIAVAIATLNYFSLEGSDDVRAWLRRSREAYLSGSGFQDADDLDAYLDHCADDVLAGLTHLGPIAIVGARRLRELAAKPVDWAWKDYVVSGTIVVVAGPPGGGKTTFVFFILLARATAGKPLTLLGRTVEPAPEGQRVVLIEGEHGESSTSRKLVKTANLLDLGDDALNRLVVVARKAVTVGSDPWKDVETLIARGAVSDIVIDTLARCAPGDANDEQEQAKIFDQVAQAIEKAPEGKMPTAWLIAHTRKSGSDALEDVAGSVQRVGQADSVIMVDPVRDKSGRVTASNVTLLKAREDPDEYPDAKALTIEDGQLTTRERYEKAKCSEEQLAKVRAVVESCESGTPLVTKQVIDEAGVRREAVFAAMRVLEGEGLLVSRGLDDQGKTTGWDVA